MIWPMLANPVSAGEPECKVPRDCDDANQCTDDTCEGGICVHTPVPDMTYCDDGDGCTYDDYCDYGVCYGYAVGCWDDNDCTLDYCDPATGCVNEPIDCDDDDACTIDFCDPECGCYYEVDGCDDGDFCTDDGCDHDDSGQCVHFPTELCDDGDACTEDGCDSETGCTQTPIDCDDGDLCTEDLCDPDAGCTHQDIECSEGQVCDPATGECVVDQDLCACVNGRVTLCHIPPGNLGNARTITVGCAARDRHLAHGDFCGPCEDDDG